MEAGGMRERITIWAPNSAQDAYGAPVKTLTKVLDSRAAFEPMLGREMFAAKAVESHIEVKFRMRYRAGVLNNYKVEHEGLLYDILSAVNVNGRNRELILYCKQVIIDG
jgi:SPP1 family predicted phage head-tail adaptor